jgi:RimJ/RimL family protein N-acetyltransferase
MGLNTLEIIELKVSDAKLLSTKLLNEPKDYIKYFDPFDFSVISIEKVIRQKKNDKYFGIFLNREIAGCYMLRGFDEGYEIPSYGVWIASEFSNSGLSTLTLYHVFSFCKLNKIKKLMLKVYPDNLIAKTLYESVGFQQTGIDKNGNKLIYHKTFNV